MIVKQYYLSCLAHASYLVADEQSQIAAIIDPSRGRLPARLPD